MKITLNSYYKKWKPETPPFTFQEFTSDDIFKCIEDSAQLMNRIEDILEGTTEGFHCLPNLLARISEHYTFLLNRSHLPQKTALLSKATYDIMMNENLHQRKQNGRSLF